MIQTTQFDVMREIVIAVAALGMPVVVVVATRWQSRKAEGAAKEVAKTAVDAAEKVATAVADVARETNKKQDVIVEQGKQIHTLVNSQKMELEHTITLQGKEIKRLLAALAEQKSKARRKRPTRRK